MKKSTNWQIWLILTVILLTVYNIAPTLFFYLQPLKAQIDAPRGAEIASHIVKRTQDLEEDAIDWLRSYCDLLHISPSSIQSEGQVIRIQCAQAKDAAALRHHLQRAGNLISTPTAQLSPLPASRADSKAVVVLRKIPAFLSENHFDFASLKSPLYQEIVLDRAAALATAAGGQRELAQSLLQEMPTDKDLLELAAQVNAIHDLFRNFPSIEKRFIANLLSGTFANRHASIERLLESINPARDRLRTHGAKDQETTLILAQTLLKKYRSLLEQNREPLSFETALSTLKADSRLDLTSCSSFFKEISIDWEKNRFSLKLQDDLIELPAAQQLLINEAAVIARSCNETLKPEDSGFSIAAHKFEDASGLLVLDLKKCMPPFLMEQKQLLTTHWHPKHPDLIAENYPIVDQADIASLPELNQKLCISFEEKNGSVWITAYGLQKILSQPSADEEMTQILSEDIRSLTSLLQLSGYNATANRNGDILFEKPNCFNLLLAATSEDFSLRGSRRFAILECSNLEQRILTENRLDTARHEELLKWHDEYNACQVSLDTKNRFDVPKPSRSKLLSNLLLSFKKMVRGDEKRVIRWGLDLSGGKSVQIQLRDAMNHPVTDEFDLKQGIEELYQRVNKMGVSEVAIRRIGSDIVLDFPSSQAMSASELIQASNMVFHVINEKFAPHNQELGASVNRFLQEVWNEALLSNLKDAQSIHAIAAKHLEARQSEAARTLYENGLRLHGSDAIATADVDESLSRIVVLRGDDFTQWHQATPLLIVFHNFALEGSQLLNIRSASDTTHGNFLSFDVDSKAKNGLYAWTSRFSKESVMGTPYEAHSRGRGWRMAVVLNGTVISAPTLDSPLKDSAMISGSFSQREVNQLASDLKAGSLSFTPHILSEKNVSPELGSSDRAKGISATLVALLLVILAMVGYYRFGGVVASVAVLFNLLIMWAVLQNLQATLTLAGIAGIILTVGMAVDANVLVFERIKEEFLKSANMAYAIKMGYQKAFSAILDSNVTTIIAALILLNFDAGPIKGFAITLIIGIASSMFTALFMTRAYFDHWIKKGREQVLQMANWIRASAFDFLKYAKFSFILSVALVVIGSYLLISQRSTLFGMDFTGGFSVELELKEGNAASLEKAFLSQGMRPQEFQIRELNPSNHLRVLFAATSQQADGHSRIQWLTDTLSANGLALTNESRSQSDSSWTSMSGQMSDTMRNHAILGLALALACIFVYLAIRFEAAYAAGAILCLVHDVLITVALMALFHALGFAVQIDLNTVAAIMTIIGYSLNDTIIIFDRIREECKDTDPTPAIVNHALNATLSRTSITSGTTLLVLVALLLMGGSSIFGFALVMTIGVFFGTLSSWFIASPLLLFFHRKSLTLSHE